MFCPNCGKYLDDRATFCTGCQQDIAPEAPEPVREQQYSYQNSGAPQSHYSGAASYTPVKVDTTNMIILSIFTTLCCCLPLGVIALYFAATAGSAKTQDEADAKMKNAKTFNIIGIVLGIIFSVIAVGLNIFTIMGSVY